MKETIREGEALRLQPTGVGEDPVEYNENYVLFLYLFDALHEIGEIRRTEVAGWDVCGEGVDGLVDEVIEQANVRSSHAPVIGQESFVSR